MARPVCVHCGQAYGQRTTEMHTIKHKTGEPCPPYRGNGQIVKERTWSTGSTQGSTGGISFVPGEDVVHRTTWDGESWHGGYDPFCTLRCALDYARTAYARNQSLRNVR